MITFSLAYTKKAQLCTKQLGTYHKMNVWKYMYVDNMQRLRDYGLPFFLLFYMWLPLNLIIRIVEKQ